MKTHELARALRRLAKILKAGPNVQLDKLHYPLTPTSPIKDSIGIALNLATLSALSRVAKAQWASFIREYNLPIRVDQRDSARNILGRLLGYLEKNPGAVDSLRRQAQAKSGDASPELMKALSIILGEE